MTVYFTFHGSRACCAVSRSARGFGPGLRGAKGRPSRRLSIAIHPASQAGGRWSGPARSGSSSPRRWAWREVLQNRGSARATAPPLSTRHPRPRAAPGCSTWPVFGAAHQPRDRRIERDVTRRRQQMRLVHHHRAKANLEQMARPAEPSVDGLGAAPVRFGEGRPQPVRVRRRHAKWA